jgi:hypothetical protein
LTQNTRTINLSQFVDYVSFSDKVVLTAISDTVTEGSERLAYRGASERGQHHQQRSGQHRQRYCRCASLM